jgi:hypothetical protein
MGRFHHKVVLTFSMAGKTCPLIGVFVSLVLMLAWGCETISISTDYRKIGTDYNEKWFRALPETPALNKVVTIDKLTIHIVSDRRDFGWDKARDPEKGIAGYANTENEIGILGKKIGEKIVVNQMVLGHEFKHILNFNDPHIVDPHDIATMEYCIGKKWEAVCDPAVSDNEKKTN